MTVGAPRERGMFGAFGKMIAGVSFARLRLPLLLIFRTPSQFCFLRVSFFSHSLPVSIPSRKVLESRLLFEGLHLRSRVLLSHKFFESWLSRDVTTVKISLILKDYYLFLLKHFLLFGRTNIAKMF